MISGSTVILRVFPDGEMQVACQPRGGMRLRPTRGRFTLNLARELLRSYGIVQCRAETGPAGASIRQRPGVSRLTLRHRNCPAKTVTGTGRRRVFGMGPGGADVSRAQMESEVVAEAAAEA